MGETARPIEWPPGSGVFADYLPEEEALVAALIRSCEAGEIDREQLAREVGILHDLKATFGARLIPDATGWYAQAA